MTDIKGENKASSTYAWPTEINLKDDGKNLEVKFDDGNKYIYKAEFLRVESPSAEVQGHSKDEKKIIKNKEDVKIKNIEPVGNYAVKLIFDDGHDTGIFSYETLIDFGENYNKIWQNYQNAINKS